MAQKKNSVSLSDTAIARLQKLVDVGEYCSLDDAASHIIVSTLPSNGQYLPVLPSTQPKPIQSEPIQTVIPSNRNFEAKPANKPRPPIEGL